MTPRSTVESDFVGNPLAEQIERDEQREVETLSSGQRHAAGGKPVDVNDVGLTFADTNLDIQRPAGRGHLRHGPIQVDESFVCHD
jgi:hypothetical protein